MESCDLYNPNISYDRYTYLIDAYYNGGYDMISPLLESSSEVFDIASYIIWNEANSDFIIKLVNDWKDCHDLIILIDMSLRNSILYHAANISEDIHSDSDKSQMYLDEYIERAKMASHMKNIFNEKKDLMGR